MYSQTKGETPDEADAILALVSINGIPYWRNATDGRTFPQVAGAEDPPPGEGDDSDAGKGDDAANDDESSTEAKIRAFREGEKRLKALLKQQGHELDALKAEDQKRKDAEKSEVERLRDQLAETERKRDEAERQHKDALVRQAIERAAAKAGAADPEDVFALLKPADFDLDDNGAIKNADKLVEALMKAKPYLAGKTTSGVPGTPRSNGQVTREAGVKEAEEKLIATRQYQPFG